MANIYYARTSEIRDALITVVMKWNVLICVFGAVGFVHVRCRWMSWTVLRHVSAVVGASLRTSCRPHYLLPHSDLQRLETPAQGTIQLFAWFGF